MGLSHPRIDKIDRLRGSLLLAAYADIQLNDYFSEATFDLADKIKEIKGVAVRGEQKIETPVEKNSVFVGDEVLVVQDIVYLNGNADWYKKEFDLSRVGV